MPKKRTVFFITAALIAIFMAAKPALAGQPARAEGKRTSERQVTMWLYPIGQFSDPATVNGFIDHFNQIYPDISVTVEYLDYASGDDQISAAVAAGTAPDIVMEGPERIVSSWGARGEMADLSDLWTADAARDISENGSFIANACRSPDGSYYEYPLCMTAHCMAINYEVFEKAGALRYLNTENRTWTTEGFRKACEAVAASGLVQTPGIVYCGGQGGDQGTRALVTNLYGAAFTNPEHTAYTIDSREGIEALKTLKSMTDTGALSYHTDIQATDEIALFTRGSTAMSFAWNSAHEKLYSPKMEFTPYAMTFPTDGTKPQLCTGIWGFGIFDNGESSRISDAKTLIRFLCDDPEQGRASVRAANFFPARHSFENVYVGTEDEARMKTFNSLFRYAGDYYNVTPGWAAQRTVWWNMLQQVFSGTDPAEAVRWYTTIANRAVNGTVRKPEAGFSKQPVQRILFIGSYSLSDPAVKEQISGIEKGTDSGTYLHFEFMDSHAISREDYVASFYRYISDKYARLSGLGAVIVGGDNALQMAIRYQSGFFRDIPVIYESVNSGTLADLADSLGMIGIRERDTIKETLDLACSLYPDSARVLAVSDDSAAGKALASHFRAVQSRYAPRSFEVLNTSTKTPAAIREKIGQAGEDTVLLYLSFTKDADNKVYSQNEALKLLTENARRPVFTLTWLNGGTLGGISADAASIGMRAGTMTGQLLSGNVTGLTGASESKIPVVAAFDASVMKQYGIGRKGFPKDAVYYNDLDAKTRQLIIVTALAAGIFLLSLLLIFFGRENRRRKKNETKLKEASSILKSEAEEDGLTGLGNRRLFDREMARSTEARRTFALFMVDLDDFKHINDGFGHAAGDLVLKETGARLNALKTRSFVPYRYGGDEFAVMVFLEQEGDLDLPEGNLMKTLSGKVATDSGNVEVHVSIGSAMFPSDASSVAELIRCADLALYETKRCGKNGARRYCRDCQLQNGISGQAESKGEAE